MTFKTNLILFFCLVVTICFSQKDINSYDFNSTIKKSIVFIKNKQYQSNSIETNSFKGEWPVEMVLENNWVLLGKSNTKHFDSNCFSQCTMYHVLARIYKMDSTQSEIRNMLKQSYSILANYKNVDSYNFWNLLTPKMRINKNKSLENQEQSRRPTNFPLRNRFMNKAANVVNDADDSALASIVNYYHKQFFTTDTLFDSVDPKIFELYLDINRKNKHWYNHTKGYDNNTGAYLTWFGQEYQFKKWNIYKDLIHNMFYFMPFSQAFPYIEKPYIPFGSNDVDAVVNVNILNYFQLTEHAGKGDDKAIKFIHSKVKKEKFDFAASYYPNRYNLTHAISLLNYKSDSLLNDSYRLSLNYIIKNQKKDGGWESRKTINNGDRIQSTVLALSTILNGDEHVFKNNLSSIEKGLDYLFLNKIENSDEIYWKGGVIFSGGSIVRKSLFWMSDSITTAMICELLIKYKAKKETLNEN